MVCEFITALYLYLTATNNAVINEAERYARYSSYKGTCDILTDANQHVEYVGSVEKDGKWIPMFTMRPENI